MIGFLGLTEFLTGAVVILVIVLFKNYSKKHDYWKLKGVPTPKPAPVFGNMLPSYTMKMNLGELHKDAVSRFPDAPLVGIYSFYQPYLLVQNNEYIERILIKDFTSFADRTQPVDRPDESYENNLFGLSGPRWKAIRTKLSPVFTTGKLKAMTDLMVECGDTVLNYIDKQSPSEIKTDVDIKALTEMFSFQIIGNCVFGIDSTELAKPKSKFQQMASKIFEQSLKRFVQFIIMSNFPQLANLLNLKQTPQDVTDFFTKVMQDAFEMRKSSNIKRNDFIQLLFQLKEKGKVEVVSWDPDDNYLNLDTDYGGKSEVTVEFTDELLMTQAMVFFTAGFDPTSNIISFALYELCQHPEIQQKLREAIKQSLETHNNKISYDMLKDTPYLEYVLNETMRMYPPIPTLFRNCTKAYTFENGVTIPPRTPIFIPTLAVHNNPNYFSQPSKFHPERWDKSMNSALPGTFLPFGDGPRMCIGMRFAMLALKIGLLILVKNYEITLSAKTKVPVKFNPVAFFTSPKDPLYFNFKKC